MDRETLALRALLGYSPDKPTGDVELRRRVASAVGCSPDYLYQVASAIPLKSGKPRLVGRELRDALNQAYPDWLTEPTAAANKTAASPTLAQALDALAVAVQALPREQRSSLSPTLSALALAPDSAALREELLQALQAQAQP